jgi:hypothetical protein
MFGVLLIRTSFLQYNQLIFEIFDELKVFSTKSIMYLVADGFNLCLLILKGKIMQIAVAR